MRYCYFILFLIVLTSKLSPQGFVVRHKLPGASDNSTKALFEISPNNYMGVGFIVDSTNGQGRTNIMIVGLGSQGQLLWTKKYVGHKIEYINNGFIQRSFYKKGNYLYYAGCVKDTAGAQIGAFLKFDMNGDTLWQRIFRDSTSIDLIPQMVTSSVDGGFLITGFFQNWVTNTQQGLILKTDANGNELWRKKMNKLAPNVQDGKAILQDSVSKKIAIVGYQYIGNQSSWSPYDNLLILDSTGNKISQTHFTYMGGIATDLIQTSDKKLVVIGWQFYSETIGSSNCNRSYAVKFDINNPNVPIWKVDGYDKLALRNGFTCAIELKNGDILIGGGMDTTQSVWGGPNVDPANILTRLTIVDKDGKIKWNRYYNYWIPQKNNYNYQGIRSINLCSDGSWLAAIEGFNYPGVNPFLFVKYDSTGCDSSLAYCKSKYEVGVDKINDIQSEILVYPNPGKDYVNIEVITNNGENWQHLEILNCLGQKLYDKVNDFQTSTVRIDVKDLPNGIYTIIVSGPKFHTVRKKIIIEK